MIFSLRTLGYAEALAEAGWQVDFYSHADAQRREMTGYSLVIWDGPIPELLLRSIKKGTTLILLGGAGDDISYYRKYAETIAVIASSMWYSDSPGPEVLLSELSAWGLAPHRLMRHAKFAVRFPQYCNPNYWKRAGIRLIYLPPAANPAHFHPTKGSICDLKWVFVGTTRNRHFIPWLAQRSCEQSWAYGVYGQDIGRLVPPTELNALYNRAEVCPNECGHGVFYRELNIRTFELGMAGRFQISDMRWLAEHEIEGYASFYSTRKSASGDWPLGLASIKDQPRLDPEDVHTYFRAHHSYAARLRRLSSEIGQELTVSSVRGALNIG